ncbi:hypothetical protein EV1_005212 [Malus domestica]
MEAWPSMATEYGASDFELDRHGREVESTGKLLRWAAIESWKCGHRGYLRGFGGVRAPVREKGRDFGEFVQSKLVVWGESMEQTSSRRPSSLGLPCSCSR